MYHCKCFPKSAVLPSADQYERLKIILFWTWKIKIERLLVRYKLYTVKYLLCKAYRSAKFHAKNGHNQGLKLLNFESFRGSAPWTPGRGSAPAPRHIKLRHIKPHPHKTSRWRARGVRYAHTHELGKLISWPLPNHNFLCTPLWERKVLLTISLHAICMQCIFHFVVLLLYFIESNNTVTFITLYIKQLQLYSWTDTVW